MNDLIQTELRDVLTKWREGNPVTSIALGHSMRFNDVLGAEEPHVFRQKKVYALVFELIDLLLAEAPLIDFEGFDVVAKEKAHDLHLSAEEQAAGTSLAWVALRRGWTRAISGFPDGHKITIQREAEA
jgi:hypothetical protein